MKYTEYLPDDIFTHHVESYWKMSDIICDKELQEYELMLPTCTFNIIFTNQPCLIKTKFSTKWKKIFPGASLVGQSTSSIFIRSTQPLSIVGVRLKPFALATIVKSPIFLLNDDFNPLSEVFNLHNSTQALIREVCRSLSTNSSVMFLMDEIMSGLLSSMKIDETVRAQLNYIMDRKGSIKIRELTDEFRVSKVTLRNHFVNKVGLTPKRVAQIWRMNHLLHLKEEQPNEKLTGLCLEAGFYDQSHFIKDFKLLLGVSPKRFFKESKSLVRISNLNISKRFTNQYDPRICT